MKMPNSSKWNAQDSYAITAMFSQAIALFIASRGGLELGINLLLWFVLLNIALKLTWGFATSQRTRSRWIYLFAVGISPFIVLAFCILISPWFDWLYFFTSGKT